MDTNEKMDQMLFTNLIMMFQTAAMQHMGKLKNPLTDKIERDLDQAKISIDIIEMLQRKTEGRRDEYENKLIKSVLQELKLNYVYEKDRKDEDQTKEANAGETGGDDDISDEKNEKKEE
jgi:hypothetical protein